MGIQPEVDFLELGELDEIGTGVTRKLHAILCTAGYSRHQFLWPLGLARRFGPAATDEACARALELDVVDITKPFHGLLGGPVAAFSGI